MEIQELKAIIKESIREVLREERMLLCQVLIPYVSDEEQEELDEMLGSLSLQLIPNLVKLKFSQLVQEEMFINKSLLNQ